MAELSPIPCKTFEDLLKLAAANNYGAIMQHFRRAMRWTGCELAHLYTEALRAQLPDEDVKPMSASWIYMMENQNMVPIDAKRRWILARLLDIPPVLFGLTILSDTPNTLFNVEPLDLTEYRATLRTYQAGWHSGASFQMLKDIRQRILNLYYQARFSSQQHEMYQLLCCYQILMGELAHHQAHYDQALDWMSRTITIAEEEHLDDILAIALRQRSSIYLERNRPAIWVHGRTAAQIDLQTGLLDAQRAQKLAPKLPDGLNGFVSLVAIQAYGYAAQTNADFKIALKMSDTAGQAIGKGVQTLSAVGQLDEEIFHYSRGQLLLLHPLVASRNAKLAQREFDLGEQNATDSIQRKVTRAIWLAHSYIVGGSYEMAVAYAEDALDIIKDRPAALHIAQLEAIYRSLRNSPYGKSSDVGRLAAKLLKVQQPGLFD